MGDAPHETPGSDGLTAEEREAAARAKAAAAARRVVLVEEIAARYGYDAQIMGDDIPRLVELVTRALDGYAAAEFGVGDWRIRREFDECRTAVAKPARAFLKAVAELRAIMPPEEGEEGFDKALERHPWLRSIDHFEGGIADVLCGGDGADRDEATRVAGEVRRAVSRIGALSVTPGHSGRPQMPRDAGAIVNAVCYYRHEQEMVAQYWWGEETGSPLNRGRVDHRPIPQTEVGVLIVLVAEAFELPATNAFLRKCLDAYQAYLKAEDRAPQLSDLSPTFDLEGPLNNNN